MKRLNFKCTLLTDVVISAQTATQGENHSLNFILGSNFLGILASSVYKKGAEKEKTYKLGYTLFHSGKVRFGDAHIVSNDIRSYQIPFSWYYPKGESLTEGKNYMLNFITKEHFEKIIEERIQLKQARDGYFNVDGNTSKYLSPSKTYSQKSAHDSDNRRSAESEMFGYEALQKGSEWQFCIDVDDDLIKENMNILEEIKTIVGAKRLGRSKTAEFGSADIEFIDEILIKDINIVPKEVELENRIVSDGEISYEKKNQNLVFLYAESRLAFRDQFGQATFTPTPEDLGLPKKVNILWDRSQIRTGVYAPWNWKRDCRDEDRVFIEKGSVFVVDFGVIKSFTDETINKGVGLYRTDGFGKLLINPGFLDFDTKTGKLNLQLKKVGTDKPSNESEVIPLDTDLIKWIKQQNDFNEVLEIVDKFIKDHAKQYSKVTNSQWGNIRSEAKRAKDKNDLLRLLFEPYIVGVQGGYLTHGITLDQWKDGKILLEETITNMQKPELVLQFVEKLSALMQKKGGSK